MFRKNAGLLHVWNCKYIEALSRMLRSFHRFCRRQVEADGLRLLIAVQRKEIKNIQVILQNAQDLSGHFFTFSAVKSPQFVQVLKGEIHRLSVSLA